MADHPTELVPGILYRVGGTVPIDGRLSWRPAALRGWDPIGGYLLLAETTALLIGTGVRLHREQILDQVTGLLGGRSLQVYVDRNEADEIGNLAPFISRFSVKQIWFGGAGHLLRWFEHDDFNGIIPKDCQITFLIPADSPDRKLIRESDRPDTIQFAEGHPLELLYTQLTVLGFSWLYDPVTKTLFSSDFFSEGFMQSADGIPVMAPDEATSLQDVSDHLDERFYWMSRADTGPLLANLESVFGTRDIERIAPYHGTVIEGRDQVRRHLELTRTVLSGHSLVRTA